MWVNLGHTSDAVEKILVQHVQIEICGQCVPFIAASKTRGKVEKESQCLTGEPKRLSGHLLPELDTSMK